MEAEHDFKMLQTWHSQNLPKMVVNSLNVVPHYY